MSSSVTDKIRVFKCTQCGEFINTSMNECKFCGATVNADAAEGAANVQDDVAAACSTANYMKILARAYPVFYVLSWIPLIGGVGTFGSIAMFFAVPIMFIYWWVKYRQIVTTDPDYPKAKSSTWISLAIWGAVVVIGFILTVVLSILSLALTQS